MNRRHPQGKHVAGPIKGDTPEVGHWFEDRAMGREIRSDFTAATGMVPTNPNNFYAAKPLPSEFRYDSIADGLTTYASPYGDGRQFVKQEEPMLTTPGPASAMIASTGVQKGAETQPNTPGFGFGPGSRLAQIDENMPRLARSPENNAATGPLGMSTGLSLGSGPKRNVTRKG